MVYYPIQRKTWLNASSNPKEHFQKYNIYGQKGKEAAADVGQWQ